MKGWTRAHYPSERARGLRQVDLTDHQREVVLDMLEVLEGDAKIIYIGGRASGRSTIIETVREIDRQGLGRQILRDERGRDGSRPASTGIDERYAAGWYAGYAAGYAGCDGDPAPSSPEESFAKEAGSGMTPVPDQEAAQREHRALQDSIAGELEANERARRPPGAIA